MGTSALSHSAGTAALSFMGVDAFEVQLMYGDWPGLEPSRALCGRLAVPSVVVYVCSLASGFGAAWSAPRLRPSGPAPRAQLRSVRHREALTRRRGKHDVVVAAPNALDEPLAHQRLSYVVLGAADLGVYHRHRDAARAQPRRQVRVMPWPGKHDERGCPRRGGTAPRPLHRRCAPSLQGGRPRQSFNARRCRTSVDHCSRRHRRCAQGCKRLQLIARQPAAPRLAGCVAARVGSRLSVCG